MNKISGFEPEKLLIEGDPHPYNNPDMDIVELAFISPGIELWAFINALKRIEDNCLEKLEKYPNAKLPRIFIGTKEQMYEDGVKTVLYACVSQRLCSSTDTEETL
jgi:hypothetical protein